MRLAVKASVKVKVILGGEDKESERDVWRVESFHLESRALYRHKGQRW